ncbi:adenylosuccinate lyase [Leptobacterium sp. I13]|uniref:adenylosuccinate lyase n=1 Tax=Leptobacterium meishanense TaxID=3128904 RepID=UPI0030EC80F2
MTVAAFYKELESLKAYRETRLRLANTVLNNSALFAPLLDKCYDFDDPISSRACWILEFVCNEGLDWLIPCLDTFTKNLVSFKLDSSIRPMAKICQMLIKSYFSKTPSMLKQRLTEKHLEKITEACFDWLINDEKVAAKAYSIYALYELGKKYDWIHPELQIVLEQNITEHSPAYKTAAKKVLKQLVK